MEEEAVKLIIDLINKLDSKFESKLEKLDSKIEEISKNLKENLDISIFKEINSKIKSLEDQIKKFDEHLSKFDLEKLNKIDHLIEKMEKYEEKLITVIEKLEKLEENIPVMFYHLKDLADYQEKLDELIAKIDNWDKIFDIEEIEYYPERIHMIKEWIEEQLRKGYSLDEIREELIKNGYSTFFINKVLKELKNKKINF